MTSLLPRIPTTAASMLSWRTLRENGKRLDYAVEDYPLKWPDEE